MSRLRETSAPLACLLQPRRRRHARVHHRRGIWMLCAVCLAQYAHVYRARSSVTSRGLVGGMSVRGDTRRKGLPLGSGAVESAVRRVINMRVKSPSTFWREDHVEGIIHLRAHSKAGRWCDIESAILSDSMWKPSARRRPAS